MPADLANWNKDDLLTAQSLAQEKADRGRQELEHEEWIQALVAPLWEQHPEKAFGEIAELLPEPEKTIVKEHAQSTFNWHALPFECRKNRRRPWHKQAEDALLGSPWRTSSRRQASLRSTSQPQPSISRFC
jgi:hypothetical protein